MLASRGFIWAEPSVFQLRICPPLSIGLLSAVVGRGWGGGDGRSLPLPARRPPELTPQQRCPSLCTYPCSLSSLPPRLLTKFCFQAISISHISPLLGSLLIASKYLRQKHHGHHTVWVMGRHQYTDNPKHNLSPFTSSLPTRASSP